MIERLYHYRFQIFLSTQFFILFGSLFFSAHFYEHYFSPILYLVSILAGILMISKQRVLMLFFVCIFLGAAVLYGSNLISRYQNNSTILIRLSIYFLFYIVVAWNIIQQVWHAKRVSKNVIMGLISGYISLGFLAFFLFMSIEMVYPGAYTGALIEKGDFTLFSESILYYAFITLLTIGYGEIVPAMPIAQKAAILVGLCGQFYLVIITAVVIEKYIRHSAKAGD